ncbi:MAG: hypothetical protein RI897_1399 [Verrucomicrobiota bacterium]
MTAGAGYRHPLFYGRGSAGFEVGAGFHVADHGLPVFAEEGWVVEAIAGIAAVGLGEVECGGDHFFLVGAGFGEREAIGVTDEGLSAGALFAVGGGADGIGDAVEDAAIGAGGLLGAAGDSFPPDGFDFIGATGGLEEDFGAGHGGDTVEFGVASIAADGHGAGDAVDFEPGDFVAAAAVALFVASGHVDFGVLVGDFA